MNIAVLGLGRSGIAVAKSAKAAGNSVTVYDSASADNPKLSERLAELEKLGIPFVGDFNGPFPKEVEQIVTSPGVDMRSKLLQEPHKRGVEVISEVEYAYRISKAPIIAITGTNGKSTTTVMTYLALLEAEQKAVLCGNIYGSGYEEVPLTEAAISATEDQVLVAEISSFQLEWVKDFRPICAGITNISPDHINRYDSFEQYANTKRRIFDRMGTGDTIVANAGDMSTFPTNVSLRDRGFGLPSVRFYGNAGADVSCDGTHLKISIMEPLSELPFEGKFNYLNACHASLLAMRYLQVKGWKSATERAAAVLNGLKKFKGLAHRMEPVGERNSIKVINNSMCTNPEAVIASSSALPNHQHLLIGGVKKEYSFEPVYEYLRKKGHSAYLFGKDAVEIARELHEDTHIFDTMEEAFSAAARKAASGDVIMLAPGCASMDQFNDFVHRGEVFKQIAMEWLSNAKEQIS